MKLTKKPAAATTNRRFVPPPEPEAPETEKTIDLDEMDRSELKAFIKEHSLDIVVNQKMTDADIREAIAEKMGTEPDAEAEPEADPEPEAEPEEKDEVDLDALDRTGLKTFIKEQELDIVVNKGMTDDDIRKAIVAKMGEEPEDGSETDPEPEDEPADAPSTSGKNGAVRSWLFRGKEVAEEAERAKAARTEFAPTFYIKDGEDKIVQFRGNDPVAGFYAYSIKDGKRWLKLTQPVDPADDLMARSGERPAFYFVYELFDRSPWTDKEGKKHRDTTRFWMVSEKAHKHLQYLVKSMNGLAGKDVKIHREGVKQPLYIVTEDKSLPPIDKKIKASKRLADEVEKYFAPPTVEVQRRLLGSMVDDAE